QVGNDKTTVSAIFPLINRDLGAVFGPGETLNIGGTLVNVANPDLRWEETEQFDLGLELGLLNDRFLAEVDFYRRVTNDILVAVPIPDYVGSRSPPIINAATVLNRGFDVNLTWQDQINQFNYRFNLVASSVYNEVLDLGQGNEAIFGGGLGVGGLLGTRTLVGEPIGSFYGYQVDGIFQNEEELDQFPRLGPEQVGDLRFADTNQDGELTPEDRVNLGSPIPNFIYGFNLEFDYAGFDLSAFFNGQSGNRIINAKRMARFGTPNFEAVFLDRWTEEGSSSTEPRITNGGHNYEPSDRFIQDGSFLRLRNLQLGYTLPKTFTDRIRISRFRIYVAGTNLITWTNYTGYTPEISSNSVIAVGIDQGQYPIARVYNAGVQVNF
ncbi:MAG: TonB-dependent receptor, partial [Bacteroidota bacterium]